MYSDFSGSIGSFGPFGSIEPSYIGLSDGAPARSFYYVKGDTSTYNEDFEGQASINSAVGHPRFHSVDGAMLPLLGYNPINGPNFSHHYDRELSSAECDGSHSEEHSSSGSEYDSPLQVYRSYNEASTAARCEIDPAPQTGHEMSHYLFKPQYPKMSEVPAQTSLEFKFAPRSAVEKIPAHQVAVSDPHFHAHPHHYYPAQIEVSENEPSRPEHTPHLPNLLLEPVHGYPDLTTMVNSSEQAVGPMVEVEFVDSKVCSICRKRITRDMIRHMRTHQKQKRFVCVFSDDACGHRSNQFNRRYDFTKHLLNKHFIYDIPEVVKTPALKDKLFHWGTCGCGQRFLAKNWLDLHVFTRDERMRCTLLSRPQGCWPE